MKFISRSDPGISKQCEVHHLKLLLTGTKPKIDKETEGIYSAEVFSQNVKNGEHFENFDEALE